MLHKAYKFATSKLCKTLRSLLESLNYCTLYGLRPSSVEILEDQRNFEKKYPSQLFAITDD